MPQLVRSLHKLVRVKDQAESDGPTPAAAYGASQCSLP